MSSSAPQDRSGKKVAKAPPPVAKGKGKGKGKGKEAAAIPPFEGGLLNALRDSNLLDVFTFLKPLEAIRWAQTNKTFATFLSSKAADVIWRTFLYSTEVDKFGEYKEKLPAARRSQIEAHFSCRRVISALSSSACSVCDGYAENFCVMTCSRVCNTCWACRGVGEHGLVVQPLSMCAVGYAKTHYLLNDKDIKSLFCLEINDATKAHGLISPKMTLVLESEARKLAEEKFKDVEGGLAAEKTSRADKAKESWEERKAATPKGKDPPKEPDSVRKERDKDAPSWHNFVSANQAFISNTPSVAAEYGFYKFVYTRAPSELLTAPPSVFVTRDSPEQVMAKHPHVTQALLDAGTCKILVNLVDAVFACANGGTLLLDMACNLPAMAAEASVTARSLFVNDWRTIGDELQDKCLLMKKDIKIEGTPRAYITSSRAVFWTINGCIFALQGVRVCITRSINLGYQQEYFAPALVVNSHCSVTSCRIETESSMYGIIMDAPSATIRDCDIITNYAGLTVYMKDIKNVIFSGNRFSLSDDQGDCGFFFVDSGAGKYTREQELAFQRQLRADNTCIETSDYHSDY